MVDFERARKFMVDTQLRTSNITDRRILGAMGHVPRELFVPERQRTLAYIDKALPLKSLGKQRFLSAPAPFARLVQLAHIEEGDTVLDLGCATGYSTAVLAKLGVRVVGVDNDAELVAGGRQNLAALGIENATIVEGPLESAAADQGPFDVIIIEGEVEVLPESVFGQLKDGGRLVAAVREPGRPAVAQVFVRSGDDVAARAEFDASMPSLEPFKRSEDFVF